MLAATAAYPVAAPGAGRAATIPLVAVSLLALAGAAALRVGALVPAATALVVASYAVFLGFRDEPAIDTAAPLVGVGLVVAAELAWWSIDLAGAPDERRLWTRRALEIAAIAVVSAAVGVLLVGASGGGFGGGVVAVAVGVAAVAASIAVITVLARQAAPPPPVD